MAYLTINSKYKADKKEVHIDYHVTIAGSKKQRKQIKKQLERLSENPSLESILEILQEFLSKNKEKLEDLVNIEPYYIPPATRRIFSSDKELEAYLSTHENLVEVDHLGGGPGWKILGAYDPNTDTIYVLRNLNSKEKTYVLAHEKAHRRRHYAGESQDEYLVDQEAATIAGYNRAGYSRAA